MNVTPEIVRAEMDYRIERARTSYAAGYPRTATRARRPWLRRLRGHGGEQAAAESATAVNGAPLAA